MSKPAIAIDSMTTSKHVEYCEQDLEKPAASGDDETARYAGAPTDIDEKTNKRLFWMVNKRVLFIMLGTYFCQSLDKGTLNFASIMGIKADANLKGQEVSTTDLLMSIFVQWPRCSKIHFKFDSLITLHSIAGLEPFSTWAFSLENFRRTSCYKSCRLLSSSP